MKPGNPKTFKLIQAHVQDLSHVPDILSFGTSRKLTRGNPTHKKSNGAFLGVTKYSVGEAHPVF